MEQKLENCIKARLVAVEDDGNYKVCVFEDLVTFGNFVMCTRCPNWNGVEPELLQEGYLSYRDVTAGKDRYYDAKDGMMKDYQYTATYYLNFVPITHVLNGNTIVTKNKLVVG